MAVPTASPSPFARAASDPPVTAHTMTIEAVRHEGLPPEPTDGGRDMADDALTFLAEAFGDYSDAERQSFLDAAPRPTADPIWLAAAALDRAEAGSPGIGAQAARA